MTTPSYISTCPEVCDLLVGGMALSELCIERGDRNAVTLSRLGERNAETLSWLGM
jgi:hypothetical protein